MRYSRAMKRLLPALVLLLIPRAAMADDYVKDVLPMMKKHCWDCHSADTEVKGNLALDPETLYDQIGTYNIIRPGNPAESGFIERLKLPEDHADFMPRKGSALPASEIEAIEKWILAGAIVDAKKMTEEETKRSQEMGAAPAVAPAATAKEEFLTWTNREGRSIEARLAGVSGDVAKLILRSGKTYDVPLSSLSEASATQARSLAAPR